MYLLHLNRWSAAYSNLLMHTHAGLYIYLWTLVGSANSGFCSKANREQKSRSGTQSEAFLKQVKVMGLQLDAGEHIPVK